MDRELHRMGPIDPELKDQYFNVLEAFINGFKEIYPDIKIIADGNSEELTLPLREFPDDSLTMEDIWKGWGAVPQLIQMECLPWITKYITW